MVVDWKVHQKMSAYATLLKDVERGFKNSNELAFASFELATQCRQSSRVLEPTIKRNKIRIVVMSKSTKK
jgi:hypothetical protein